jgi:hypothetical protein
MEWVSEKQSAVYGLAAIGLGGVVLFIALSTRKSDAERIH